MGLKTALTIWTLPRLSVNHVAFLQNLVKTAGFTKVFPPDFPHATHQALVLPLAKPGMSQADITRHVYMLAAAGVEVTRIVRLMNLRCARMLELWVVSGKLYQSQRLSLRTLILKGTLTASCSVVVCQSP